MRRSKNSNNYSAVNPARFNVNLRPQLLGLILALLTISFATSGCNLTGGGSSKASRSPDGPAMAMAMGLYQRGASLQTMAARGGASYSSGSKRHYFKFEVAALKPGQILFTAIDPTGRPAFKMASDGQQITAILYGDKQFASGPATLENFSKFLPLGLTPDELMSIMAGSQVKPEAAGSKGSGDNTELIIQPAGKQADEANLWRLKLRGGLDQNPDATAIITASLGSVSRPAVSIKYLSIKDVPREDLDSRLEPFPHSVEVVWTDGKEQTLKVTYDEVRLGLDLGGISFSLQKPEGFEFVPLD